ncbi:nucleotidyltransferase [Candidatus Woesebacteria bacterium]|nr:nucleotidyltransferase [Candidatus Woesebacteria bacterium]
MPRTIDEGFRDFHEKLKIVNSESEAVKSHRASIKACLENNFGMTNFFRTGSIGNGTNVNGYSDTDYFSVIPRENLSDNSITSLRKVKEALQTRFPSSNIYVDSPAVVVDFGSKASETTEIIPSDYMKTENGVNIYDIPDTYGSWMKSSPMANNKYVTQLNESLGFKVKPLIRFIKAWKFYNNVPISSFYLEMRTAKYISTQDSIIYSIDIRDVFKYLIDINLAKIIDPVGVGGYIDGLKTENAKTETLSKLNTAYTRAVNAKSCENANNISDSFYWWNLIFAEKFPSYYY